MTDYHDLMGVECIDASVERINNASNDTEVFHVYEDEMLHAFARFVAARDGDPEAQAMAKRIVAHLDATAGEPRWYA